MPFISDYSCSICGHHWEEMTGARQEIPAGCPKCKAHQISREYGGHRTKLHDPDVRAEALKKRSLDHSARTAKESIERMASGGKVKLQ